MKILFISNFLNHHQKPVADHLFNEFGDDYRFVSLEPMPDRFKSFGYPDYEAITYNELYYKDEETKNIVREQVLTFDVVIIGGFYYAYNELIDLRLSTKKLLLLYAERFYKNISMYFKWPLHWLNGHNQQLFTRFNGTNTYMLCSGAYVAKDCHLNFSFKNRTFKWGYFPKFEQRDIELICRKKKSKKILDIIWVARFIDWKHPENAIKAVLALKKANIPFKLNLFGGVDNSDMTSLKTFESCKEIVRKYHLEKDVIFAGNLPNAQLMLEFEKADVFLFTSDRHEGWGVVLNEAMSMGCCCIGANMIGAVPYLIQDGKNGLIYKNNNISDLQQKLLYVALNPELRMKLSKNAYLTIRDIWHPSICADSLVELSKNLLTNQQINKQEGPCSYA